jgi:DNA helicase MCM9
MQDADESARWSLEKLQAYISYVKSIKPVMTAESEQILTRYYQMQRLADTRNAARTTLRLLEGMVRLAQVYGCERLASPACSFAHAHAHARTHTHAHAHTLTHQQAHARLMCRDKVGMQDAIVALTVMECSLQGAALLGQASPLHSAFPTDPEGEVGRPHASLHSPLASLTSLTYSPAV